MHNTLLKTLMKEVIGHVQKFAWVIIYIIPLSVVFEQCYSGASMTTFITQKANARSQVTYKKYRFFKFAPKAFNFDIDTASLWHSFEKWFSVY